MQNFIHLALIIVLIANQAAFSFLETRQSVPPYAYHGTRWNDWNSVGEEFADMFANWVKGSFSVDEAGNIRNGFMQAYMGTYIYQFANK